MGGEHHIMATRRTKGEGTIDKTSDGLFRWRGYARDPATGESIRKSLKAKNRKELMEKVKRWKAESGAARRYRIKEWAAVWLRSISGTLKAKTYRDYASNLKNHLIMQFGDRYLDSVTALDIQRYLSGLAENHTVITIRSIRARLSVFFEAARSAGYIRQNPVHAAKLPKDSKPRERQILTTDEVRRLLDVAKTCSYRQSPRDPQEELMAKQHYLIILVAVVTGMRQGEILALQWSDVDTAARVITVRASLQNIPVTTPGGGRRRVTTKSGKTRRVCISSDLARALTDWQRYQSKYAKKYRGLYINKENLVFTNTLGDTVDSARFAARVFRPVLRTAGITGVRFHDLRHYAASYLLSQGVPVRAVSEQLGHSGCDVTLRIYAEMIHEMSDKLTMAVEAMPFFAENEGGKENDEN